MAVKQVHFQRIHRLSVRLCRMPVFLVLAMLLLTPISAVAADIYAFVGEDGETFYTNNRVPGAYKVRLPLISGKKNSFRQQARRERKNESYESAIAHSSEFFDVDPDLVRSVIKVESNYNPLAVSRKGALGLMQLMPGTARELGVDDPLDPAANIHGGVMYLRRLLDVLDGDLPLSLAAYNAGLERVKARKGIPAIPETQNYVRRVLEYYERMKALAR